MLSAGCTIASIASLYGHFPPTYPSQTRSLLLFSITYDTVHVIRPRVEILTSTRPCRRPRRTNGQRNELAVGDWMSGANYPIVSVVRLCRMQRSRDSDSLCRIFTLFEYYLWSFLELPNWCDSKMKRFACMFSKIFDIWWLSPQSTAEKSAETLTLLWIRFSNRNSRKCCEPTGHAYRHLIHSLSNSNRIILRFYVSRLQKKITTPWEGKASKLSTRKNCPKCWKQHAWMEGGRTSPR